MVFGVLLVLYVGVGDVDLGVEVLLMFVVWERMLIFLVVMLKYVLREYCWNFDVSFLVDVLKFRCVFKELVFGLDILIIFY